MLALLCYMLRCLWVQHITGVAEISLLPHRRARATSRWQTKAVSYSQVPTSPHSPDAHGFAACPDEHNMSIYDANRLVV